MITDTATNFFSDCDVNVAVVSMLLLGIAVSLGIAALVMLLLGMGRPSLLSSAPQSTVVIVQLQVHCILHYHGSGGQMEARMQGQEPGDEQDVERDDEREVERPEEAEHCHVPVQETQQ